MTVNSTNESAYDVPAALPYATPTSRPGSPTTAAAVISFLGLGLIILGGCFLIGVLMCSQDVGGSNSYGIPLLVAVLYLLAFGCFGGAVWLLWIGIRRLIGIMRA
jgi:hypothetical protein